MINEMIEIFTDPAHVVAELMWEGVFFVLGILWVRRHDRKHHPKDVRGKLRSSLRRGGDDHEKQRGLDESITSSDCGNATSSNDFA